jgi:hypothetical protein
MYLMYPGGFGTVALLHSTITQTAREQTGGWEPALAAAFIPQFGS